MMAEKKIEKCAHPGCNRPVTKGAKYHSDYCESSGSRMSIACNCGQGSSPRLLLLYRPYVKIVRPSHFLANLDEAGGDKLGCGRINANSQQRLTKTRR
jgi:hypothetical protein